MGEPRSSEPPDASPRLSQSSGSAGHVTQLRACQSLVSLQPEHTHSVLWFFWMVKLWTSRAGERLSPRAPGAATRPFAVGAGADGGRIVSLRCFIFSWLTLEEEEEEEQPQTTAQHTYKPQVWLGFSSKSVCGFSLQSLWSHLLPVLVVSNGTVYICVDYLSLEEMQEVNVHVVLQLTWPRRISLPAQLTSTSSQ